MKRSSQPRMQRHHMRRERKNLHKHWVVCCCSFFSFVFLFFTSESKRSLVTQITFKQFRQNPHEFTHATTTITTKEGRHAGKTDHFHRFLLLCYSLLSQRTNYISIFDMFKNTYDAIFSPRQDEVLRWMLPPNSCDFIFGIVAVDD